MKTKKLFLIIVAVAAGVIILNFLLNLYVKQKAEAELSSLEPPVNYNDLKVNVLTNNFSLTEVETRQKTFSLTAKKVQLSGLSYYGFLFEDKVDINELRLEEPNISYIPQDRVPEDTAQKRHFEVRSFLLKNGKFSRRDSDTTEADLFLSFPEAELKGIKNINDLDFSSYNVKLDSVFLKMNTEHAIQIKNAEAEDGRVEISDLKIVPFYSKREFDQKIPYEKDRISLQVENISMQDFEFKKVRDTLLLTDSKITVSNAFLELYRNKLVTDDDRRKSLYSELLRKAPVKLNFKEVLVENSEIIYEEQVQQSRPPAVIRFTDVSAEIMNLNNLISEDLPQPKITARANFMRGTPVNLSWTFPVFDPANSFNISGSFGTLEGEALDPFLVPALDLQARGQINSIKFNFYGNENVLSGDFIMDYKDLKVELLKDNGSEKRSFFSAIANLFVDNKGKPQAQDKKIEVERNKQRSFWNYVWLGLRKGFMNTVSQL